jgi:chemotaxis protein histidine kinase CheA
MRYDLATWRDLMLANGFATINLVHAKEPSRRGYGARAVVSKEIVGRHGGSIEVRSENGSHSGTVFNILLPLASEIREDANKGGGVVGLSLFLISHCS